MLRSSLILLTILTACLKDETISGQTDSTDLWMLSALNDMPISKRITIEFPEEGRVKGQAPCNRYFGEQTAPLPWFDLKQVGATKMACPDLKLETDYFALLQKMTLIEVANDTLILRNDSNETLVFKKD